MSTINWHEIVKDLLAHDHVPGVYDQFVMYVCSASSPQHVDLLNEDFVGSTSVGAVVIDGAGTPEGADSGCVHGVAWYSCALGHALAAQLADLERPLRDCLAQAIIHVRDLHGPDCDLGHPGTPSSTVTAIRENGARLDYLVLADSPLVLDLVGGIEVICDHRVNAFQREKPASMYEQPRGSAEYQAGLTEYVAAWRRHRNVEGGFWFASSEPDAAAHALAGKRTAARHARRRSPQRRSQPPGRPVRSAQLA